MHFSMPDIEQVKDEGRSYISYIIYLNGFPYASIRYNSFRGLYETIKAKYQLDVNFPPKNIMMSDYEIEERRDMLEKFVQFLAQQSLILADNYVKKFFFTSHLNFYFKLIPQSVLNSNNYLIKPDTFKIYLSLKEPYQKHLSFCFNSLINLNSFNVLKKISMQVQLPHEYMKFYNLFLVYTQLIPNHSINIIYVNKLTDLQSPLQCYVTLKNSCIKFNQDKTIYQGPFVLFKTKFWDPKYNHIILKNVTASKLYLHQLYDNGYVGIDDMNMLYSDSFETLDESQQLHNLRLAYEKLIKNKDVWQSFSKSNLIQPQNRTTLCGNNPLAPNLFGLLCIYRLDYSKSPSDLTNNNSDVDNNCKICHPCHHDSKCSTTCLTLKTCGQSRPQSFYTSPTAKFLSVFSLSKKNGAILHSTNGAITGSTPSTGHRRDNFVVHVSECYVGLKGLLILGCLRAALPVEQNDVAGQTYNPKCESVPACTDTTLFFKMSRIKSWRITTFQTNTTARYCCHLDHNTVDSKTILKNTKYAGTDNPKHYCTNRVRYSLSFQYLSPNDQDFEWVTFEGMAFPLFLSACLHDIVEELMFNEHDNETTSDIKKAYIRPNPNLLSSSLIMNGSQINDANEPYKATYENPKFNNKLIYKSLVKQPTPLF